MSGASAPPPFVRAHFIKQRRDCLTNILPEEQAESKAGQIQETEGAFSSTASIAGDNSLSRPGEPQSGLTLSLNPVELTL